jgi:phosphoribosylformylglycinamidine synthase
VTHAHLGGRPPAVDLDAERALGTVLVAAAERGLLTSAHDVSDGGLAQALVESCLRHGVGARITLVGDPFVALCSESTARAVVSLPPDRVAELGSLCRDSGVPIARLGEVGEPGSDLVVEGQFAIPIDELRATAEATLPRYFA